MPAVSVIIALYGEHHGRRVLPAVTAAWLGQDVACEVIVAAAAPIVEALPVATRRAVKIVAADASITTPGLLRNRAAARASAPWLYLSDADVAPLGVDFLRRALALAGADVLAQPWMYRLIGPVDGAVRAPAPAAGCCFVRASPDGLLQPAGGERFRTRHPGGPLSDDEVIAVLPPPSEHDAGIEERRRWVAAFHWGAILLERPLFEQVGGYCRRYRGWGSEDDDLLVKLAAGRRVTRAWRADRTIACLHHEHPRQNLESAQVRANRALYAERVAAGTAAMVAEDRARPRLS